MRKEIFLAIVVGIIVGLGITFGLFSVRERIFPNTTALEINTSRQQNPTPTPTAQRSLNIQQPENNLLTDQSTVKIVGRALPDSYITVLGQADEYITIADKDGDFAQDIELELGGNQVTVIAISPDGEQEEVVLSLVYSTVNLNEEIASESAAADEENNQ